MMLVKVVAVQVQELNDITKIVWLGILHRLVSDGNGISSIALLNSGSTKEFHVPYTLNVHIDTTSARWPVEDKTKEAMLRIGRC